MLGKDASGKTRTGSGEPVLVGWDVFWCFVVLALGLEAEAGVAVDGAGGVLGVLDASAGLVLDDIVTPADLRGDTVGERVYCRPASLARPLALRQFIRYGSNT